VFPVVKLSPRKERQLEREYEMQAVAEPNVFKTVQASASGNTALWTPATGKKFRLMRLIVQIPANVSLAARGVLTISFQDNTTDISLTFDHYVGQTAPVETASSEQPNFDTGWIDLGNGIVSTTANNVLNVNLSAALAAGKVRITCCGTEE
jgi:hypothetical protein